MVPTRDMTAADVSVQPRIASLVPSVTELLVALGLRSQLVARTGFCIHPIEALRDVPKVGGTKDVNLAKLRRLAPTHVVVNVDENRLDTIEAMRAWGDTAPEIVVTHPRDPAHNIDLVAQLVAAFGGVPGVTDAADRIAAALHRELAATQPEGRPSQRVLYLIWRDPWMTVARDTYISRTLARVGWQTLPDVHGGDTGAARYPALRGDEPWLADVELVLLSSEPYRFTEHDMAAAAALCPNAVVRLVDGEMLSWYGVRAIAGLAYLRDIAMALPD